jgi:hypothetical protein
MQISNDKLPAEPNRFHQHGWGLAQSPCVLVVGRRLRALSVNALLEGSLVHDPLQIHFSPTRLGTVYFGLPCGVTLLVDTQSPSVLVLDAGSPEQ